jgi:tetratricopeptide (TPR) repeat protein
LQTPEKLVAIRATTFEASLVEEINHFNDPRKSLILAMAHVYHRFYAAFLEHLTQWPGLQDIAPELQYQDLVRELSSLSFIRHSSTSERLELHDEMRRLVNTYCWQTQDEDRRMRRELSKLALIYYNQLIAQEKNEETRQSYIVERFFHELFLDRDNGFDSFTQHFNHALNFSLHATARALVEELAKFKDGLTTEQRLMADLAEARVLHEEDNPAAALDLLLRLEHDDSWAQRYRFDLLGEKGSCYLQLYKYLQAIECFEGCLEIARKNGNSQLYAQQLSRLGYVHRLQGHYSKAMTYYEEALRIQRNQDDHGGYAMLLNNISNVRRLQGNLDDALNLCKIALRMRRDLFEQGKVSEQDVGLSMSTLGHIYHNMGDIFEEDAAYREAYEIYNRVGDKKAVAAIHNYIGRIWMKKQDTVNARKNFDEALRIAAGVHLEVEIESYNQIGRLVLRQKQWQEAHNFFERAVKRSRAIGLEFELAENLLYLALTCDYMELPLAEHIKEAKRIAWRNDHSYVLAFAEEIQGDMLLRRGEYLSAFKHYRVACRYYAERSRPEYDKFLHNLNDKLLELPANYLPGVIDLLLSYWSELELDKSYPQLPGICREVSRHMLL